MTTMLINATHPEELRVALIDKNYSLYNIDFQRLSQQTIVNNIYKAKIIRIEPSLEAVFVNYGAERHGFLPLKEISPEYFRTSVPQGRERPNIKDLLSEGQEIIVQVVREEQGNKGAALTSYVRLAGSYLVLMLKNPRAGGVSRHIQGDERDEMRDILSSLEIPENSGVIVRTAGGGKTFEEIDWDLSVLLQLWEAIEKTASESPAPFLIYEESDVVLRAIRDDLRHNVEEIWIDSFEQYTKVQDYLKLVRPDYDLSKVKFYQDNKVPLFSRFNDIERQIETAFQRKVQLPSGGVIVVDHTEALTAIDINSARATKGGDIEETALHTNLEAAQAIPRQLRLRDIGGLVVIDFIDMHKESHRREVENTLREACTMDPARTQFGRISSRFGLLVMTRQQLRPSLGDSSHHICPRCNGQGNIRGVESLALSILRLIREHASRERTAMVRAQLPVEVASFLLNEKRKTVSHIQETYNVNINIIPNPNLETPHYKIERIRDDEDSRMCEPSYRSLQQTKTMPSAERGNRMYATEPALKGLPIIPSPSTQKSTGLFNRIIKSVFGGEQNDMPKSEVPADKPPVVEKEASEPNKGRRQNRSSGNRRRRNNQQQDRKDQNRQNNRRDDERTGSDDRQRNTNNRTKRKEPANKQASQVKKPTVAYDESGEVTGNVALAENPQTNMSSDANEQKNQTARKRTRGPRRGPHGKKRRSPTQENKTTDENEKHHEVTAPVEQASTEQANTEQTDTSNPAAEQKQNTNNKNRRHNRHPHNRHSRKPNEKNTDDNNANAPQQGELIVDLKDQNDSSTDDNK